MEKKKNSSMIRRLIHRDSLPQISVGNQLAAKTQKGRRKSEGMLPLPEHYTAPKPTMPSWFLKDVKTRDEAEEILNKQRVGTFLVRKSETSKLAGSYTLSLLHKDKCRHHKIETNLNNNKLVIKGYENHQFDDLDKLVNFFVNSQRKDITLRPFDPSAVPDQVHGIVEEQEQPAYEEMDGSECRDEYQTMSSDGAAGSPPPLPKRREDQASAQSYMNLPSRDQPPPLPPQSSQSYENIPSKDSRPPPPSPTSAPPLPPRVPPSNPGSYENIPGRPPPVSRNYENFNANGKYENHPPPTSNVHSTPGHSYQNLPPKITPRKPSANKAYHSAEQSLPPRRQNVPFRRSQTDSPQDWQKRGYNL